MSLRWSCFVLKTTLWITLPGRGRPICGWRRAKSGCRGTPSSTCWAFATITKMPTKNIKESVSFIIVGSGRRCGCNCSKTEPRVFDILTKWSRLFRPANFAPHNTWCDVIIIDELWVPLSLETCSKRWTRHLAYHQIQGRALRILFDELRVIITGSGVALCSALIFAANKAMGGFTRPMPISE